MSRRMSRHVALGLLALLAACNQAPVPGLARGEELYTTCAKCHGALGAGDQSLGAPAIGGLPAWYVQAQIEGFKIGHRGYDPFDTAGIRMKSISWGLDRAGDDSSVALYVASLNPGTIAPVLQGNAAGGQTTFTTVCATCHGPNAGGNPDVHAPPLAGRSDWYLHSQLQKFKSGARGAQPNDIWGATMRAQAMMLDDSTMSNVVAYIQSLRGNGSTP
jgi:cytochrome c oxidase subunit 2